MKILRWCGALVLVSTVAGAQQHAVNLTLLKTSIRTQNDSLILQSSGIQAFTPTG
jgi:hypothetical protein